jgi:hypothetical protein
MAACGGSPSAPDTTSTPTNPGAGFPAATLSLTASPIAQSAIRWITPLGNLNPPDHTLPTDHIYFYFANPNGGESPQVQRTPFFAPGDGTATFIIGGGAGQETKVIFRQTATFSYYLDHIILDAAMKVGDKVTAGQRLGTTGNAYAVDLGVINDAITVPFLVPARYNSGDSLHADAPLKYFSEPIRSQLYARVERLGADLDGTINYDIAGRLSGNWFATVNTALPFSFAYDTYDPSRVLLSIGSGTLQGVWSIAPTDPAPRDVSVASGKVLYTVRHTQSGPHPALDGTPVYFLIQMTDDTHMRSELSTVPISDFTSAVRTWVR